MTTYVLVPGAWLGAWAWEQVAARLSQSGHRVVAVTLSGLAERHDEGAAEVSLAQHVDDVIEGAGTASDVVLVGHSYAGIPVGQAATRLADRLDRVVYVDANLPHHGRSLLDSWSPAGQQHARAEIAESGGFWLPLGADDYAGQDLSREAVATIVERSTPHPGMTLTEPAHLTRPIADLPTTYVKCLLSGEEPSTDVKEHLTSPRWRLAELKTGHWPMFSRPTDLAEVLTHVAAS